MEYDDLSCPFLRLKADLNASATYPNLEHVCNRTRPFSNPSIGYQLTFCLKAFHTTCPVFTGQRVAMPAGIRGPGLRTSSPRLTPALTLWTIIRYTSLAVILIVGGTLLWLYISSLDAQPAAALVVVLPTETRATHLFVPPTVWETPTPRPKQPTWTPYGNPTDTDTLAPTGTATAMLSFSLTPTPAATLTRTPTALMTRTKTKTPGPTTIHPPTLTYNPTHANQTITFNPLLNKTYGDLPFTVSASATSGLAVSFGTSGNCSHTGNTISITGAGGCTVTASQGGNASYNPAVDVSQSFTISKANGCNIYGWSGSYDGNAHGAGGSCQGTGVLNKGAAYNNVPGGDADWSYTGDTNYNSQSGSVTITINKADPTFSFDSPGDQYYIDTPFDITVSATASSGVSVTFDASGSCTNSNGSSTITITGTGTCTVTASVDGTSNYNSGVMNPPVTFNITGP